MLRNWNILRTFAKDYGCNWIFPELIGRCHAQTEWLCRT